MSDKPKVIKRKELLKRNNPFEIIQDECEITAKALESWRKNNVIKHKEYSTLLLCDCSSLEHQIILRYEESDNMIFAGIHLNKLPFLKRMILGIKYIFGYSCKYGHFEEFVLKREHAWKLQKLANDLKYGIDSPNI